MLDALWAALDAPARRGCVGRRRTVHLSTDRETSGRSSRRSCSAAARDRHSLSSPTTTSSTKNAFVAVPLDGRDPASALIVRGAGLVVTENRSLLVAAARHEAVPDALTGLATAASSRRPRRGGRADDRAALLALFDLDGFKRLQRHVRPSRGRRAPRAPRRAARRAPSAALARPTDGRRRVLPARTLPRATVRRRSSSGPATRSANRGSATQSAPRSAWPSSRATRRRSSRR